MMSDEHDDAVLQTLVDRLLRFRLPRLLSIKARVDQGEPLTDDDIVFLKAAMADAQAGQQYVMRNPEFHDLGARIVQLYSGIVSKAMENEQGRSGP